ncbi:hypothetical protein GCM10011529_05740 [Polymorphobacter glacialis]|uniref:Flagellar biosynthesis protein FlgJ n=1 Tax=Sandarakinorhabdus glacialis TaxID=1614636 RepID=A0A916ZLM7_9SPHN|nr:hypothetical protein [Polymorphobacter glacialis]GGE02182.1 hypothetical protein GCM10011529_05740 [Polymorphobacter glacialis]
MQLAIAPTGFPLKPPPLRAPDAARRDAEIALKFETLIAETLLRSARAAQLGDDGLGASGGQVRDMIDHSRAEAIARAAPLGVARLLAAERARTMPEPRRMETQK